MASATPTTTPSSNKKEIVREVPPYIRVFSDGTVERLIQIPFVPPLLDDPKTGISSKDIIISHSPPISARIYLPKLTNEKEKLPILVYFHGGSFFLGSPFSQWFHDYINSYLAPQGKFIVVSVEYRLAPENPLPACYRDSWDALKWVASHSDNKTTVNTEPWLIENGDFDKVFIGGDSAGANIAHNIAMRAGAEALPGNVRVLGALLCHPFFYGSEYVLDPEVDSSILAWKFVYPSAPGGIDNPMINPMSAGAPSLASLGCSKMIVCVAGKDQFKLRDRGVWYYEAVKNSGWHGKIELFEEAEEDHCYHVLHPETENALKLNKLLASFLQE